MTNQRMNNIKEFLYANRLKQVELAKYLGITEAQTSRLTNEVSKLSESHLRKILNNDRGWDTSMLVPVKEISKPINPALGETPSENIADGYKDEIIQMLREEVAHLRSQIEWMRGLIDKSNEKTV